MKRIIMIVCGMASIVLIIISFTGIMKKKNSPYPHAYELQYDSLNEGLPCIVTVKAPFYAHRHMFLDGAGTYEYTWLPAYDSSDERRGDIVYVRFNDSDEEAMNALYSANTILEKSKEPKELTLTGRMVNCEMVSHSTQEFDEAVENYLPFLKNNEKYSSIVPADADYSLKPLSFLYTGEDLEPVKPSLTAQYITLGAALVLFIIFIVLAVGEVRDIR